MTEPTFSIALADLAHQLRREIHQLFAVVPTTAPAQQARLDAWLARCVAQDAAAAHEESLTSALRDLVTLRNGQLGFAVPPSRPGTNQVAAITADFGGALLLGQAVVALLRCIARHDPRTAQRLCHDVLRTDARQRAEIAPAIGR